MPRLDIALAAGMSVLLAWPPTDSFGQGTPPIRQPTQTLGAGERLLSIQTRPGVNVRVLFTAGHGTIKGLVVLLPGGPGFLVNADGTFYGGFRREFARRGFAVSIVDAPSDQPHGLEEGGKYDKFRVDPRHADDARIVVDRLSHEATGPIYLFGHSMGAISAAYMAAKLDEPRLAAVILASSPTQRGDPLAKWTSLPSAPLNQIKIPVLLLHHWRDACRGSTYEGAREYRRLFTASPRVSFIEVRGGNPPESSNPCSGNNYHSYFGVRNEVVDGIVRWLEGADIDNVGN